MRAFQLVAMLVAGITLASSVARAGCTIFQHRDFAGASWWFNAGDRMKMVNGQSTCISTGGHCPSCETCEYFEPSWNDEVSSFTVEPGCTITLWEHVNEGGAFFRTWQSYSYVGSDWNDEASEALCTCP
jgi:hypothetical protein